MGKILLTLMTVFCLSNAANSEPAEMFDLPKVKGLIRHVDMNSSRIKLKHERIPNLNMPAMTMTFDVADANMLTNLAAGDSVLFSAIEQNGNTVIIWLEKMTEE